MDTVTQFESSQIANGDEDASQLAVLGYASNFKRSMTLWENFSLGFTYLSPVVGAYSLLAFGLSTGGPPMIWSYLIAAGGMMMVCLVFGEIVSQFPISGGVYPWARRLAGKRWSWMTGWVYGWAMYATIAGVAVGAGSFVGPLLDIPVTPLSTTAIALALVALATFFNLLGTRVLARVAFFGFICEIAGGLAVGAWLLAFHRLQPVSVFFDSFGIAQNGSYLPAFLASTLVGMFCCYGFEACGDLAEEVPDAGRLIPRTMLMTIYVGIPVTVFSVAGLILAIPDMHEVIAGKTSDPVASILIGGFGTVGYRIILGVVLVSFISCVLSLQAAVSRLVFSYARDRMILGSSVLSRMSAQAQVPVASLLLAGLIPGFIIGLGYFAEHALSTIVSFAAVGIYIAFQMVVLAALYARINGWKPSGKFRLGGWAWPVNLIALLFGTVAIANVLWPRAQDDQASSPFAQLLTVAGVLVLGLVYLFAAKPEQRSDRPAGDAWR